MKKKNNNDTEASGDQLPVAQQPPAQKQYLPEEGEEYMRESGNIEDLPDPEQDKEADQQTKTRK